MKETKHLSYKVVFLLTALSVFCVSGSDAEAIPPPEIVRVGSVFAHVLGFLFVFFSTVVLLVRNKVSYLFSERKLKFVLFFALSLVVLLAFTVSAIFVRQKNRDILAGISAAKEPAMVTEGFMTVAGMQFDIADPSFKIGPSEAAKLLGNEEYLFIDIREPVEFSIRHVPNFVNVRIGDLVAGEEYKKLDKKKTIVLICEVGERGSAVAVFLRLRGYQALYIDNGIRGWTKNKLKFIGNKTMQLPDYRNKYKTVSIEEAKGMLAEGKTVLVDMRPHSDFGKGHFAGAINIPLMNITTSVLEKALNQLPKDSHVICIAYDRFGAYYCKIFGYLLIEKGIKYVGTLNIKPGEQTL